MGLPGMVDESKLRVRMDQRGRMPYQILERRQLEV